MDESIRRLAIELIESGVGELSEREHRIIARIANKRSVSRGMHAQHEKLGERIADHVARIGGSWAFIGSFGLFLLVWAILNVLLLPEASRFDPYPFIFLNLLLSMLAAIQAPIIMMSQNRQAERDRAQATMDYEVNLRAELEIKELHEKIDRLLERKSGS